MAEPVYAGVFLTPKSRERLLSFVHPIHEVVLADHMTIMFKPFKLFIENLDLGKKVRLRVTSQAYDARVQAVEVAGVLSANKIAHITISTNPNLGGTPKQSNVMLDDALHNKTLLPVVPELFLDGIIDVFPRTKTETGDLNNG